MKFIHGKKVIPSEEVRRLMEHGGRPVTRTIYRYATSSYHEITHAEFHTLLHGEEIFCVVVGRHIIHSQKLQRKPE